MTSTTAQTTCPITDEPAQVDLERFGNFREFDCPTCGRFRMSDTAVRLIVDLKKYSQPERIGFLQQAKRNAAPGTVPMIKNIG